MKSFAKYFFKLTVFTLILAAVFPKKKLFKNRVGIFLLYKVWPIVFVLMWLPLVPMAVAKLFQYYSNRKWDELLDSTQIFLAGILTLYMLYIVQITADNYRLTIEILSEQFRTTHKITLREYFVVLMSWVTVPICFLLFIGSCIYYKELMVPLWVPLIDNDKELSVELYYGIWLCESLFAPYIYANFSIWGPFIIVSTTCICKELEYLSNAVSWYGSHHFRIDNLQRGQEDRPSNKTENTETLRKRPDMLRFWRKVVQHHLTITSAVNHVSRINSYVFLVQTVVVVVHSCVLAFNVYYTNHLEKVMVKSSPILFFSYFLMFAYCWNGQQLTNKSEEFVAAFYRFPWYECPHSYKKSMLIWMECLKQPVHLGGGGVMKASLETFLRCFQQSFSYILVLKALTPEKGQVFKDENLHQENLTTQNKVDGTW